MTRATPDPLVSIIIPAFNAGQVLALAIESALAQTYSNTEIILINDGSTSSTTKEIAKRYQGKITYIEQANAGVAAARNTGLANANGDLIALLDQDDLWLPNKLTREVEAICSHPKTSLVHSSYLLINEKGEQTGQVRLAGGRWTPLPSLLIEVHISACTTLFPRKLALDLGGFDPQLSGSDDWDLWLRMALQVNSFFCIEEPLAKYRVHPSMASNNDLFMLNTAFRVLDKFYALPDLLAIAKQARSQAYCARHLWATSIFYGSGDLDQARRYFREVIAHSPEPNEYEKLLSTLPASRAQAEHRPVQVRDIHNALLFIEGEATANNLPSVVHRSLRSHAKLLQAVYGRSRQYPLSSLARIASVLIRNPMLVLDKRIWHGLERIARRILRRPQKVPGKPLGI